MKTIGIIGAAAALCCLAACEKYDSAAASKLAYQEFTAAISGAGLTRVELGVPDAQSNKVPVVWQTGDQVLLVYPSGNYNASVSTVTDGKATIAGTLPEGESPTAAYYPADAFQEGALALPPAVQADGELPLRMKGTVAGSKITFSAAEGGSAVVGYALTGDITVRSLGLYVKASADVFYESKNTAAKNAPEYSLTLPQPVTLTEAARDFYFVVPGGKEMFYTLEITDSNGRKYVRRKNSVLRLASGTATFLPDLSMTQAGLTMEKTVWKFGENEPDNALFNISQTSDGGTFEPVGDHLTVTMNNQGSNNFRADMQLTQSVAYHAGNYRFLAIKTSARRLVVDKQDVPEGWTVSSAGKFYLEFNPLGKYRNNDTSYSGFLTFEGSKAEVFYFDLLPKFGAGNYVKTAEVSQTGVHSSGYSIQFKVADFKLTGSGANPTYDVYWIGFFNSPEEIEAFAAAN